MQNPSSTKPENNIGILQQPCSCSHCSRKGKIVDFSNDQKEIDKLKIRIEILSDPSECLKSAQVIWFEIKDRNNKRYFASLTPDQLKFPTISPTPEFEPHPNCIYEFETIKQFCRIWTISDATLNQPYTATINTISSNLYEKSSDKLSAKEFSSSKLSDLYTQLFREKTDINIAMEPVPKFSIKN